MPEIEETKSGSLIKGMKTQRCLNPLMPDFQSLNKNDKNVFCQNNISAGPITSSPSVIIGLKETTTTDLSLNKDKSSKIQLTNVNSRQIK